LIQQERRLTRSLDARHAQNVPGPHTAFDAVLPVSDYVPFSVHSVHIDGSRVLALIGEIDISVADRLWAVIEGITLSPEATLILDMHQVTFFDVSGLRVLLRALERLDHNPERLILRSPTPIVRRVLSATDTARLMTIEGARQESRRLTNHRVG